MMLFKRGFRCHKRQLFALIFSIVLVFSPLASHALQVSNFPNSQVYDGWATDSENILSDSTEASPDRATSESEAEINAFLIEFVESIYFPFILSLFLFWLSIFVFYFAFRYYRPKVYLTPTGSSTISNPAFKTYLANIFEVPDRIFFDSSSLQDDEKHPYQRVLNSLSGFFISIFLALAATLALLTPLQEQSSILQVIFTFLGNHETLMICSMIGTAIVAFFWLKPHYERAKGFYRYYCKSCKKAMEIMPEAAFTPWLTEMQKKASELKTVEYEALQCPHCSTTSRSFHLRTYLNAKKYIECPNCKAFTAEKSSKVLKKVTHSKPGLGLKIKDCHCCDYYHEEEYEIPIYD